MDGNSKMKTLEKLLLHPAADMKSDEILSTVNNLTAHSSDCCLEISYKLAIRTKIALPEILQKGGAIRFGIW